MKPILPPALATDPQVRDGMRVIAVESRFVGKRELAEVRIELSKGGELVFDAIVAGFEQYRRKRTLDDFNERGVHLDDALKAAIVRGDVKAQQTLLDELSQWSQEAPDPKSFHNGRCVVEVRKP